MHYSRHMPSPGWFEPEFTAAGAGAQNDSDCTKTASTKCCDLSAS